MDYLKSPNKREDQSSKNIDFDLGLAAVFGIICVDNVWG